MSAEFFSRYRALLEEIESYSQTANISKISRKLNYYPKMAEGDDLISIEFRSYSSVPLASIPVNDSTLAVIQRIYMSATMPRSITNKPYIVVRTDRLNDNLSLLPELPNKIEDIIREKFLSIGFSSEAVVDFEYAPDAFNDNTAYFRVSDKFFNEFVKAYKHRKSEEEFGADDT